MAINQKGLDEILQRQSARKQSAPVLAKDTSGQLQAVVPNNLQQRSELRGQSSPGNTPLSGQLIGGTPDQTKMQGTPAQLQGALRSSVEPSEQLSTAKRQEQARDVLTEQENKRKEQSEKLRAAGQHAQAAATDMISAEIGKLASVEAQALPGNSSINWSTDLSRGAINKDPASRTAEEQAAIHNDLVKYMDDQTKAGNPVTPESIASLFPNQADQIAAMANTAIQEKMQLSTDFIKGLGLGEQVQNIDQLNADLGLELPPNATLKDLQEAITGAVEKEQNSTAKLREQMSNPNVSASDRAEARKQLMDMGSLGLSASEQQAHEAEMATKEAGKIQFAGKEYEASDLFKDENFSQLVKSFYEDPTTSDKMREEAKTNPATKKLVDWLDKQQGTLGNIANELKKEASSAISTVAENKKLMDNSPGIPQFSEDIMKLQYGPNWASHGTGKLETPKGGLMELAKAAKPVPGVDQAVNIMNQLARSPFMDQGQLSGFMKGINAQNVHLLQTPEARNYFDILQRDPAQRTEAERETVKNIKGMNDLSSAGSELALNNQVQAFGGKQGESNRQVHKLMNMIDPKIRSGFEDGKIDEGDISRITDLNALEFLSKSIGEGAISLQPNQQKELNEAIDSGKVNITNKVMADNNVPNLTNLKKMSSDMETNKTDINNTITSLSKLESEGRLSKDGIAALNYARDTMNNYNKKQRELNALEKKKDKEFKANRGNKER